MPKRSTRSTPAKRVRNRPVGMSMRTTAEGTGFTAATYIGIATGRTPGRLRRRKPQVEGGNSFDATGSQSPKHTVWLGKTKRLESENKRSLEMAMFPGAAEFPHLTGLSKLFDLSNSCLSVTHCLD